MTKTDAERLDEDTDNGTSRAILVLGKGASTVPAVREAESDWGLRAWCPPDLASRVDGAMGLDDWWLVAIPQGHEAELDRDPAVIAYAPAWRRHEDPIDA